MSALDVFNTLDETRVFAGINQLKMKHQPRLLSDKGTWYIAGELSDHLFDDVHQHAARERSARAERYM